MRGSGKSHSQVKSRLTTKKRLVFTLLTVTLFFAASEIGLRLAGLGTPPVVGTLQFGYPSGIPRYDTDGIEREHERYQYPLFEEDENLFWRPIAMTPFTGADGLRRPVPDLPGKPAETYRLAVLSDSCSFLGHELYPNRFAKLAAEHLGRPVDVVNASCVGYTSFQGMRRLESLWECDPDLLVVYFGWNDHWKSLNGCTDRQLAERRTSLGRAPRWLRHSRIYGLMRSWLGAKPSAAGRIELETAPLRVPLDEYRANLESIVRAAARKCPVALITAPTSFNNEALPGWAFDFFSTTYAMSEQEVQRIPNVHAAYNDVVREVALTHEKATLLDLARLWEPAANLLRFRDDCIHLTETGHRDAAEALFDVWRREIRID